MGGLISPVWRVPHTDHTKKNGSSTHGALAVWGALQLRTGSEEGSVFIPIVLLGKLSLGAPTSQLWEVLHTAGLTAHHPERVTSSA